MTYETIVFVEEGGIAHLQLARPDALNALNRPLLGEVIDALDRVRDGGNVRVLLLTGKGRGFSSGADLSSGGIPQEPGLLDAGQVLEDYYNPLIERMFALPVPIVAGVHGAVAGAACMLALAADITVAAQSAFFLQAFAKVGLVPDAGSLWLLPRLIGRARAQAMMMLAERIPAATALDWGMIYEVVDEDALYSRVNSIAHKLARGPTRAYAMIRQGVRLASEQTLSDALALERRLQKEAGETCDFQEGVAAFREKRPPNFTGA
ncbi:Enoyl-CoA hydratase [Sphingobium herbicidovorans NBRC 16415]|uniref:Enoyl-CoA hydratase n=1 Tax=Sphingobium herbicidovorans (strain ATCC 700291 / DSM 11019 / CCUG 56400 / KCTC 2939 / LMG 18315 / NBRC 16415 / MH) TaxID=1219045 RepID=A0A086PC09_SPHHM|nr:enoyl-CoA hydratase-related protein [Sphingobium herbicidovorans]KFG90927.1 Enoyl-CoA hydratase [Sphingobium herbicidovorans NBRC 16415]